MIKLIEQQLFDYMFCPAKYEMRYVKGIDLSDPISLPRLLNKVAKFFLFNLLNGKVCSINELKSKWDSISKQYPDFIDSKKNVAGWGLIINLVQWAARNQINVVDVDTAYQAIIGDAEIKGCMAPIIMSEGTIQQLVLNFNDKVPDQADIDMKSKYTLDVMAFNKMFNRELDGIRIHTVKSDKDIYTRRIDPDFKSLEADITGVINGIKNDVFYRRTTSLCNNCTGRPYCRYWFR
jgi:hypothetical protein